MRRRGAAAWEASRLPLFDARLDPAERSGAAEARAALGRAIREARARRGTAPPLARATPLPSPIATFAPRTPPPALRASVTRFRGRVLEVPGSRSRRSASSTGS